MINSLTASANAGANNTTQKAESLLTVMQADMAAAIKNKQQENKQQDSIAQKSNLKPAASNDKPSSATAAKELDAISITGDRDGMGRQNAV